MKKKGLMKNCFCFDYVLIMTMKALINGQVFLISLWFYFCSEAYYFRIFSWMHRLRISWYWKYFGYPRVFKSKQIVFVGLKKWESIFEDWIKLVYFFIYFDNLLIFGLFTFWTLFNEDLLDSLNFVYPYSHCIDMITF